VNKGTTPGNPKIVGIEMDFGVGELIPTKCTQKVIEESSM